MRSEFTTPAHLRDIENSDAPLRQAMARLTLNTLRPGFYALTLETGNWLETARAGDGLLTAFIRHTSASLTIQEIADPSVRIDLMQALERFAPESRSYRHHTEGPDDMPAHIKSMLTSTSMTIPVVGGRLDLGTWQDLYLIEHRAHPHERTVTLHYLGT